MLNNQQIIKGIIMKDKTKFLILVFLTLFTFLFNGCIGRNVSKDAIDISSNKGILITKFHSNIYNIRVVISRNPKDIFNFQRIELYDWKTEVYTKKDPNNLSSSTTTELRTIKDLLKVVPLKSGKAYISRIHKGDYFVKLDPYYFNIEPGTVTYIGDLYINWNLKGHFAQIRIIDNEDETIAEAKQKYPLVFEKYLYKKNIPEITIETVTGFEEVEELKDLKEKMKNEKDNFE